MLWGAPRCSSVDEVLTRRVTIPVMPGSDPTPPTSKLFTVSGRVQGVGYRYFVLQQAQDLGLSGWVKNQRDGRVTAYSQGSDALLRRFELALRRGPAMSRVEQCIESPAPYEPCSTFEIRY